MRKKKKKAEEAKASDEPQKRNLWSFPVRIQHPPPTPPHPDLPDFGLLREERVLAKIAGSFSNQQGNEFAETKKKIVFESHCCS